MSQLAQSMNTETVVETPNVEPVVTTENQTTEAPETEQVAQPETAEGQEPQKKEQTPAEKAENAAAQKQRRIDRLTRERYEERGAFQARIKELESRLPTSVEHPADRTETTPTQADVDRRAQEIVEVREFNKQCNALVAEGKKEFKAEFEESLNTIRDEGLVLLDPQTGKPSEFLKNILDSDAPHKLLHYLGQNPEVAAEIADLSPGKQARRLGKLEDELSAPPKRSNAPVPLEPVKGSGRASGEPDPKDTVAWVAWRNKQVSRR